MRRTKLVLFILFSGIKRVMVSHTSSYCKSTVWSWDFSLKQGWNLGILGGKKTIKTNTFALNTTKESHDLHAFCFVLSRNPFQPSIRNKHRVIFPCWTNVTEQALCNKQSSSDPNDIFFISPNENNNYLDMTW